MPTLGIVGSWASGDKGSDDQILENVSPAHIYFKKSLFLRQKKKATPAGKRGLHKEEISLEC